MTELKRPHPSDFRSHIRRERHEPVELPAGALDLIGAEQLLQELDIRGLASGDSAEFARAVNQLREAVQKRMALAYEHGRSRSLLMLLAGLFFGAFAGGALTSALWHFRGVIMS